MTEKSNAPTPNWEQFWQMSSVGAIDLNAADPVSASLREFWIHQGEWLAHCASILDVGCGNAILLRLLSAARPNATLTVWTCVDQAKLPDSISVEFGERVKLMDGMSFEESAPAVPCVSAIVSNFGIEYAQSRAAVRACAAWLAPGGRMTLVMHARDSLIDAVSVTNAGDLRAALADGGVFDCAVDLFRAMADLPSSPLARMAHGVDARDAFNKAVGGLTQRMNARAQASTTLVNILQAIQRLAPIALGGDLVQALQSVNHFKVQHQQELGRIEAMHRCALSAGQANAFAELLTEVGLCDARANALECSLGLVAWVVTARR